MSVDFSEQENGFNTFAITECAGKLRTLAKSCSSLEEVAQIATSLIYEKQLDRLGSKQSCALVRFFRTVDFDKLETPLKELVTANGNSHSGTDKFLTLLGTSGIEDNWNDRSLSAGHRAIPVISAEMIAQSPMIAHLVSQLGIEISSLITKQSSQLKFKNPVDRDYNIFYVPDALDSPYIPSQTDFVKPYKIKSVVGYGSLLEDGHFYAVIMFYKTFVPDLALKRFTALALSTTIATLSIPLDNIFKSDSTKG